MSGHRWLIADTGDGPVSVNVDGVHFTAHSVALRQVHDDGPDLLSPMLRPRVVEYEITLRVRPTENHVSLQIYDMAVFLTADQKIGRDDEGNLLR